ncbi:DMT family transporter [Oceaniglobus ichthyenteri]|uniref:DMT family transporter n=1 Tax=Oceaniglobus ichthyenteri TaxID=2136177 RepID=UPI000D3B6DDE|nr:DMT family transporter [Oceaniglobus ichthyenteri]
MTDSAKSNITGALLSLLAFGVFATHDVVVKVLGSHYAPFQIIFFSVLFSFPLATLMLMRDKTSGTLRPVHPWWTALRTLAAVMTGFSAFYAFSVLPLAQTYAILFASPMLITILSIPVLKEKVGAHRWAAILLGLVGVFVVLRPGATELSLGHLAAITASVGSATASVIVRKIGRKERSAVLMLYPMVANFVVMACILPFVYRPMPLEHLGLVGVISAFGFIAGLLTIAAYRAGDAAIVAPMQYSQILWAAGYGILFFDETPDTFTLIGAGIIIASGLYIVLRETTRGVSRNTPVLENRSPRETGSAPRISQMLRDRATRFPPSYESLAKDRAKH